MSLNLIFYKILENKAISKERSLNKGLETYEFGTHSIGLVTTISSNQFLILAILFLLFDIELVFLIPWTIGIGTLINPSNIIILLFSHCIIYSLVLELYFNILNWYKLNKHLYL